MRPTCAVPGGPTSATLARLHGSRLQLQVSALAFQMLEGQSALAALVSQAELPCGWEANPSSGFADQVSSLSSLTKLTLPTRFPVLREAGMLDSLRQLSALQSLCCCSDDMQTLLVHSVPRSWPLLTQLQITASHVMDAPDLSLVEQQCPQLQALAVHKVTSLCLTALTSLTCTYWLSQDSFQCSQLAHLHVRIGADINLLPSTITSLSLEPHRRPYLGMYPGMGNLRDQHLRSQLSLVHICFRSHLSNLPNIQKLLPAIHPVSTHVTSVELTVHPQAFIPPDITGSMAGQHFCHLDAWFPYLQRLHIHLQERTYEPLKLKEVLISAAWLSAHWRLVFTHKLTCPVHIVECPSGCLSLPLSSRPADECLDAM